HSNKRALPVMQRESLAIFEGLAKRIRQEVPLFKQSEAPRNLLQIEAAPSSSVGVPPVNSPAETMASDPSANQASHERVISSFPAGKLITLGGEMNAASIVERLKQEGFTKAHLSELSEDIEGYILNSKVEGKENSVSLEKLNQKWGNVFHLESTMEFA